MSFRELLKLLTKILSFKERTQGTQISLSLLS